MFDDFFLFALTRLICWRTHQANFMQFLFEPAKWRPKHLALSDKHSLLSTTFKYLRTHCTYKRILVRLHLAAFLSRFPVDPSWNSRSQAYFPLEHETRSRKTKSSSSRSHSIVTLFHARVLYTAQETALPPKNEERSDASKERDKERPVDEHTRETRRDLPPMIISLGSLRECTESSDAPVDLGIGRELRDSCLRLKKVDIGSTLTSNSANSSLMYSRRTPRDLPMDARNMIPSTSMRNGIRNRENVNDTTSHNHAILSTVERTERRALLHLRAANREMRNALCRREALNSSLQTLRHVTLHKAEYACADKNVTDWKF